MTKEEQTTSILFAGIPTIFGGLTNERELIEECPPIFWMYDNPWLIYVKKVMAQGGGRTNTWKWKSDCEREQRKKLAYFVSMLQSFIEFENKTAVAAWILSEILEEVPES